MRTLSILSTAALICATIPAIAAPRHTMRAIANIRHASIRSHKAGHATIRHEAGMDPERATEIQQALITKGYMSGEPSGVWDAQSAAAMQRLQADNGWQTKLVPDSRALIKLGLGPQQSTIATAAGPQ